jgi:hypothetical protein
VIAKSSAPPDPTPQEIEMSNVKHTPGQFTGFLGNGAWLLAVHTTKCARQRRRVTPAARIRTLVPNRGEQFLVAMRERAAIAKAAGSAA